MYRLIALARQAPFTPVPLPGLDYDLEAMLAAVRGDTSLLIICNPNNPTGGYLAPRELRGFVARVPLDTVVVLDEAYGEFVTSPAYEDSAAWLGEHPNLVILRTFSKIYGLAGERIGWGTGAPAIVDALNRIRAPFNVTVSGQKAALAALDDQAFVAAAREHNRKERQRLAENIEALGNFGLRVVPSEANFLLVLFEGALTAERALGGLAERGFAVRHLPGQGLPQALRITIGTVEQMDAVAEGLRQMAQGAA
jgi:histidinol-phosphate aminotransferase